MTFDVTSALQNANSKKKKKYVLFLYKSRTVDERDARTIERAAASSLPDYIILRLETADEGLKVLLFKNVELIIIDHSFLREDAYAVEFALEAKKRKKVPVFFTTRSDANLIREYRRQMSIFEEMDDYFVTPLDFIELGRKLKRTTQAAGRAAKRFELDVSVDIMRVNSGQVLKGTLTDLSLVGVGLKLKDEQMLERSEQLRIALQLSDFGLFHPIYGDVLRLAVRARRMSIDGSTIGGSLEHLTQLQTDTLIQLLELMSKKRRGGRSKALTGAATPSS